MRGVYLLLDLLKESAVVVIDVHSEFSMMIFCVILRCIIFRLHLAVIEHVKIEERAGFHGLGRVDFTLCTLLREQVIVSVDLTISLHHVTHGFL